MSKIKRTGSSGRLKPRPPSRLAATHPVRKQGPSTQTLVSRQMYWSIQNANAAANEENSRQIDDSLVNHFDLQPTPSTEPSEVESATLQTQQPQGVTGGSTLSGGQNIPVGLIPPPA